MLMRSEKVGSSNLRSVILLCVCLATLIGAMALASAVQRDFGRVQVSNVNFKNDNGIAVRAKLLQPQTVNADQRFPGVVYIHGYQNNRETGDAYCIELARRGLVVLNIDAIGRGNSGIPSAPTDANFDQTYGGLSALNYLRSLPNIDPQALGMLGHSLGAEMAYRVALQDSSVNALVITGFAYTTAADQNKPRNMLMIIGKWDEYRDRMTGIRDIETEWMQTAATRQVIGDPHPQIGVTYGDFNAGTARRVVVPASIHIQESHSHQAIAETVRWIKQALAPPEAFWLDPRRQIWPIKEWATLAAMLAGIWMVMPLASLLSSIPFFQSIQGHPSSAYVCKPNARWKYGIINGVIMWLYLPLIFILFGIHIYLAPIDKAFPMMLVNAIVWWFLWINIIGFIVFQIWFRKVGIPRGLTLADMGISFSAGGFDLPTKTIGKTALLALLLFAVAYLCEHLLEQFYIVDYRFIFPFASDLTVYRFKMLFLYFPFLLVGFLQTGVFLHGQMRPAAAGTPLRTWLRWSAINILTMVLPLIAFLSIQYLPLLINGFIPLVGPGGMFVNFIINLFHIIGVLVVVIPLSTWLFQLTGKIYLGAFTCAAIVAWMFASSQVIAPIPI